MCNGSVVCVSSFNTKVPPDPVSSLGGGAEDARGPAELGVAVRPAERTGPGWRKCDKRFTYLGNEMSPIVILKLRSNDALCE